MITNLNEFRKLNENHGEQGEIDFEKPITDNLLAFLQSKQDALEISKKYDEIDAKEGMYGTRSAYHASYGQLEFEGKEYGYHTGQIYTYPNFKAKHGDMPSIVGFTLRTPDHKNNIGERLYFTWPTFEKYIQPLIKSSKS